MVAQFRRSVRHVVGPGTARHRPSVRWRYVLHHTQWSTPVFGDGLPIRLLNIDTPELRSRCKTPELKDEEKRLGRISRDYLIDQLQQATAIQITHLERGSFFRVVADVYVDNRWLNERMVAAGHAVGVYDNSSADWCQIIQDRWDSE